MTVVYVDSVFMLNTAMDYLLLLSAGRLAGVPLRRGRYLLAAFLGGVYAVMVFLPGAAFLAWAPVKLSAGVLMALIAYGGEEKFLRLTLLLLAVSCGMAGCVLALGLLAGSRVPVVSGVFYTDVNARVLLIAAAAAYVVLHVVFRAAARHGLQGELVPVRIFLCGRTAELTALLDTGNSLRDPATGRPVLVAARGALDGILPPEVRHLLTPVALEEPAQVLESLLAAAPVLHARLVPYRAVGVRSGLLLAIRSDWLEIGGDRYPGVPVGISPTGLGDGYSALWGGGIRTGGRHGHVQREMAAAAGAAGPAAGGEHPLHRRQRYAAVTADERTGGCPAGAVGRRECPEGVDRA